MYVPRATGRITGSVIKYVVETDPATPRHLHRRLHELMRRGHAVVRILLLHARELIDCLVQGQRNQNPHRVT